MTRGGLVLVSFCAISAGAASVRQDSVIDDEQLKPTDVWKLDVIRPEDRSRCCCQEAEPEPKYLCYDTRLGKAFLPAVLKKPKTLRRGSLIKEITFTPTVETLSSCVKDKVQMAAGITTAFRWDNQSVPQPYHKTEVAYVEELQKNTWSAFTFPENAKKKYPKYVNEAGGKAMGALQDKHIEMNGVVYGPHSPNNPPKESLHFTPVCVKYQKTASVAVKKSKPTLDILTNEFSFGTTCTEVHTCIEYKIAHGCGWSTSQDVFFLKRKGRTDGTCEVPKKGMLGESCPSGMFHNNGKAYSFCDCAALGEGLCQTGNEKKK